jgi:hypothetical protein
MCTEYFAITFMFSPDNDRILCNAPPHLGASTKTIKSSFDKTYIPVLTIGNVQGRFFRFLIIALKLAAAGGWLAVASSFACLVCNLQDNATVVCRQVRSYKVRRNASNSVLLFDIKQEGSFE